MSSTGEFSYIKVSRTKRAIVDDHENVATFGTKSIVKQYTVDDFIHFNEQIEKRSIPKYDGNPNTFGDPDPTTKVKSYSIPLHSVPYFDQTKYIDKSVQPSVRFSFDYHRLRNAYPHDVYSCFQQTLDYR